MKKQLLTAAVFALIGFLAAAQPWMMRPQGPVNEFSALEGTSVLNYNMVPERLNLGKTFSPVHSSLSS